MKTRQKDADNTKKAVDKGIKIIRTSAGLRDALFDELDALREGKTNPQRAHAMAKLAVQIIGTVRMEIEFQRHVASLPDAANAALTVPLQLSHRDR